MKQKLVTISITEESIELARSQSKKILGRTNISGLYTYFINEQKKRDAETPR